MIFANVALGAWGLDLVRNFADFCGKCEFILHLTKVRRGLPLYCTDQAPLFSAAASSRPTRCFYGLIAKRPWHDREAAVPGACY